MEPLAPDDPAAGTTAALEATMEATNAMIGMASLRYVIHTPCSKPLLDTPRRVRLRSSEILARPVAGHKNELSRPEGFRYAVEVRHRSWLGADLPEMLRERGVALTLIDYPRMPRMDEATARILADLICRLGHGPASGELFRGRRAVFHLLLRQQQAASTV